MRTFVQLLELDANWSAYKVSFSIPICNFHPFLSLSFHLFLLVLIPNHAFKWKNAWMRCKCGVKSLPDRQHNNCIDMYEFGWYIHALAARASTAKSVHWNPSMYWSTLENTTRKSAAGKIPKIHTTEIHSAKRKHQQPFLKLTVLMWWKPKTWAMDRRINYFISCYMF